MWRDYFPKGNIYAIDIYDKDLKEERIKIFKGNQTDSDFLNKIHKQTGNFDLIVDDGSHINKDVIESFNILFPMLNDGGIYVVEDTLTSYLREFGGDDNLRNPDTTLNFFKGLVDNINYEERNVSVFHEPTYLDDNVDSIHFYHNLIFVYKIAKIK